MSQEKQHIYPRKPRETELEGPLSSKKTVGAEQVNQSSVDQILSRDAEEFLRRNKQTGGQ